MDDQYLALLRGINVGGKNKQPMQQLAAIFGAAGCSRVRTYIQSGDVVFGADPELARQLPALVAAAITEQFGYQVPVVTRSAAELHRTARDNPFLQQGADPGALHVAFLADSPTADRAATLDPDRSPPDYFVLRGRELYLHCPNGLARTRLTNAYFDARLATVCTMRNWKTTLRLVEMTGGIDC